MPRRLFWKTYPYYIFIIAIALILTSIIASREMRRMYIEEATNTLEARARLVDTNIRQDLAHRDLNAIDTQCKFLGRLTDTRITVIDGYGTVLGDSDEDPHIMENHGSRLLPVQIKDSAEIANATNAGLTVFEARASRDIREDFHTLALKVFENSPPL